MISDFTTHLFVSTSYVSPASPIEAELYLTARERNKRDGITGFLHHEGGSWSQYSEGPDAPLAAMVRRIRIDGRHSEMTDLVCLFCAKPRFTSFLMAMMHYDVVSFAIYQWQRGRSSTEMRVATAEDLIEYFIFCGTKPQMQTY